MNTCVAAGSRGEDEIGAIKAVFLGKAVDGDAVFKGGYLLFLRLRRELLIFLATLSDPPYELMIIMTALVFQVDRLLM